MTTSDYLTQLQQDRQDLVDNLETMGITGLSGDETFTELVPEVLNISSGSQIPTNLTELNEQSDELLKKINDYLLSIPTNYDVYTSNSINLYTPNLDNNFYVIRYRNGGYQGMWFPISIINLLSEVLFTVNKIKCTGYSINNPDLICFRSHAEYSSESISPTVYLTSNSYSTVEECIQALQSSTTTYTTTSSSNFGYTKVSQNIYIPYTNMPIALSAITNFEVKKISANETINVIQ